MATNPERPTVLEALRDRLAGKIADGWAIAAAVSNACDVLGIDPDLPLLTLRERLATAKRVRHAPAGADHYPKGSYLSPLDDRELARIVGWDDCLAWLRGEQTP